MTRPAADSVKVLWTGTGTGTMTLGSAVSGFQIFPATLNGFVVSYEITHQTSPERENGVGVYTSAGTTLSRLRVTFSTNSNALVNFSAGDKHVKLSGLAHDLIENRATTNPTANDNFDAGYIAGRSRWLNTSTDTLWFCVDDGFGASPTIAVWEAIGGVGNVTSVNGQTGNVSLDADDIQAINVPSNYTPAGSPNGSISAHLIGLDNALGGFAADAAPTQDTTAGATRNLTLSNRLHTNEELISQQANTDFRVAADATAGSKWLIQVRHDGCTVNSGGGSGTPSPSPARLVNGSVVIVEVLDVTGSPLTPNVVLVRNGVIAPGTTVAGTKTYDNDDHGQDFDLTSGAGTQTFGAVAGFNTGFYANIFNHSGGNITIAGADANLTLPSPGAVTVRKHASGALVGYGSGGPVTLDAA